MNKDYLHNQFKSLEGTFDLHETPDGHQKRFLEKLNAENQSTKSNNWWKPMSIAASILVIVGISFTYLSTPTINAADLASVSPEME